MRRKNELSVAVDDATLAGRRKAVEGAGLQIHPRHALQVHQEREIASEGCVTDE